MMRALIAAFVSLPLAVTAQTIIKQPMPQGYATDEIRVQWETDSNPPGTQNVLLWGASSAPAVTTQLAPGHFLHRATVTGFAPSALVSYRVQSGPSLSGGSLLRTAPAPATPFRMAWIADNQDQAGTPFVSVLNRVVAHAPDVIGHAGDTVQNGDQLAEWQSQWFDPFVAAQSLGQFVPVLVARGNHDGEFALAQAYHWLPGNGEWTALTIGRVRFLFLDSNLVSAEQENFIRDELASVESRSADFRIAVFHKPPYTNLWDQPGYLGEPYVRGVWVPLLEAGHVDLVVSGHAHAYERGFQNGITYTIVGGAGAALDTVPQSPPWPFITVAQPVHHFALMQVNGRSLRWTAYDLADHVIDSFELRSTTGVPVFPYD